MGQLISRNRPGSTPSFAISGSGDRAFASLAPGVRLDQINSQQMIRWARLIYYRYLETCFDGREPLGVVLMGATGQGRVVFRLPVLLPEEHFLPIDLIRHRSRTRQRSRTRPTVAPSAPLGSTPRQSSPP